MSAKRGRVAAKLRESHFGLRMFRYEGARLATAVDAERVLRNLRKVKRRPWFAPVAAAMDRLAKRRAELDDRMSPASVPAVNSPLDGLAWAFDQAMREAEHWHVLPEALVAAVDRALRLDTDTMPAYLEGALRAFGKKEALRQDRMLVHTLAGRLALRGVPLSARNGRAQVARQLGMTEAKVRKLLYGR